MTQEARTRITSIIRYALQELSYSTQYDPEAHCNHLFTRYGVRIDEDAIAYEIDDIEEILSNEDRELEV
jgi:hypothetical protein